MHILRKSALVFTLAVFAFASLWFGLALGVNHTMRTPVPLERALNSSGVYQTAVDDMVKQAVQEQHAQASDISLNDPQIQTIIKNALPPSYVQTQMEQVINGIYAWLQGKTAEPNFTVNLSGAKTKIVDGLVSYAQQRFSSLPMCPLSTAYAMQNQTIDPFTVTCRPPFVDASQVGASVRQQVESSDIFKQTTLSGADLKGPNGQPIAKEYRYAPAAYRRMQNAIWVLGFLTAASAFGIIFLSKRWQLGIKKLGVLSLLVGVLLIAFGAGLGRVLVIAAQNIKPSQGTSVEMTQKVMHVAQLLAAPIRQWWLEYGIVLAAIGLVCIVAYLYLRMRPTPLEPKNTQNPGEDLNKKPLQAPAIPVKDPKKQP